MSKDNTTVSVAKGYNPTPEQIKEWKAKHKQVRKISTARPGAEEDSGERCVAFVRLPNWKDLKHGMAAGKKAGQELTSLETIFTNCLLGADPEVHENDTVRGGIIIKFGELVEIADAEIEKV